MRCPIRLPRSSKSPLDQADALLGGSALDDYRGRGLKPPIWAEVNLLAHASYEHLASVAARTGRTRGWERALGLLAEDLVRLDLSGTSLAQLQRAVLIPLELDLLAGACIEPASPMELVQLVRTALDRHPIGR